MTADGRISIAGLNTHNLEYVAEAFHKVSDGKPL
jgi:aspartate/tyrosine/aromatic aminotransferase